MVKVNFHNSGKHRVSTLDFTDDQRKAYDNLIDFINDDYDEKDYKRALSGPAGTGKTYLIRSLIENCNKSYSVIGLAAPTHKACRILAESIRIPNVKINTLQSDLGLRLNFDIDKFDINNPPFDPKGKIKIGNFHLYIVDEASMIPRGLLMYLEKIAKSNATKLIYVGDAFQLPPVNEGYSAAFKSQKTEVLTQIVRQEQDNPVRYLLELLRFDITHKSYKFLEYISKNRESFDEDNIKGYRVCNDITFKEAIDRNFSDEQLTKNVDFCKIVAYTNTNVSNWNKYVRHSIIENANSSILTKHDLITSYITIVNQFNEAVIKNSEDYIIKDIVNYVHPKYEIKGFLCRFVAIHGGNVTAPLFVVDHSDAYSMQKYLQLSRSLVDAAKGASIKLRAQRWREYYEFKESCLLLVNILKADNKILFSRDLDYGFALTSHKSQGSTFDTVFVDVNDIVFDRYGKPYTNAENVNRLLYVACSRCRNKLYLRYGN